MQQANSQHETKLRDISNNSTKIRDYRSLPLNSLLFTELLEIPPRAIKERKEIEARHIGNEEVSLLVDDIII